MPHQVDRWKVFKFHHCTTARGFGLNGPRQVQEWHSMHTELLSVRVWRLASRTLVTVQLVNDGGSFCLDDANYIFCIIISSSVCILCRSCTWRGPFRPKPRSCSMQFEDLPSVNLVWHDLKLQHSSSNIVGIEEPECGMPTENPSFKYVCNQRVGRLSM